MLLCRVVFLIFYFVRTMYIIYIYILLHCCCIYVYIQKYTYTDNSNTIIYSSIVVQGEVRVVRGVESVESHHHACGRSVMW